MLFIYRHCSNESIENGLTVKMIKLIIGPQSSRHTKVHTDSRVLDKK